MHYEVCETKQTHPVDRSSYERNTNFCLCIFGLYHNLNMFDVIRAEGKHGFISFTQCNSLKNAGWFHFVFIHQKIQSNDRYDADLYENKLFRCMHMAYQNK